MWHRPADSPDVAVAAAPASSLERLGRALGTIANVVGHFGLAVGIALLGGIGSSFYLIETGTRLTTITIGPWVAWTTAATPDADPYTRARIARRASLPVSASVALSFEARTDEDGQRLHAGCDYVLESARMDDGWWSLAVYDEEGRLIPNAADRYALNTASIVRNPDGGFAVTLARDARPGNWLPTGNAGRLTMVLRLIEAGGARNAAVVDRGMPTIRKVGCR
jgi:hypothetical protein